jgi:hypothetical protein
MVRRIFMFGAATSVVLTPSFARASIFGEENAALTTLVAQAAVELSQMAETIAQLKQTYDETRKYVGMAEDAVQGFEDFTRWGQSVIDNPAAALDGLMPDVGYLRRQMASPKSWGKGTGELQRLVRVCLSGGGKDSGGPFGGVLKECAEFHQAVSARQARDSIQGTFGVGPEDRADIATVDIEAASAISGSMEKAGQATLAKEQARALLEKCTHGTDAAALQACQAAANAAQMLQAGQTARINEQLAESTRLAAVAAAQRNMQEKRAAFEAEQREAAARAGTELLAPARIKLKTAGFEVW